MRKATVLAGLALGFVLVAVEVAQAQFSFSFGRGSRGGRFYGVSTPYFSGSYSRGYYPGWYGGGYYGSRGWYGDDWYGGYRPYRGYTLSFGSPYYDSYYSSPYYYSSPSYYSSSPYYYSSPSYYSAGPSYYSSPGVVYPAEGEESSVIRQANYAPSANRATIHVRVPHENARVWFDDALTQQTGMSRVFTTPDLERDRDFTYSVRCAWTENGREVTRNKQVSVRAGQEATVSFMDQASEAENRAVPASERTPANNRAVPSGPDNRNPADRDRDLPGRQNREQPPEE